MNELEAKREQCQKDIEKLQEELRSIHKKIEDSKVLNWDKIPVGNIAVLENGSRAIKVSGVKQPMLLTGYGNCFYNPDFHPYTDPMSDCYSRPVKVIGNLSKLVQKLGE